MNQTAECEFWPQIPSRCDVIFILLTFFTALSVVGCLFIIAVIFLFKLYKYFIQRLILYLSVCAIIKALTFFVPFDKSYHVCQCQAFMLQFFDWAQLLWVSSITVNIVMAVRGIQTFEYERYFHLFVWCFSLFWSVVPFFGNYYGPAGSWCWIKRDASAVRFGVWYVPLLIIILVMIIAYTYVICLAFKPKNDIDGSDFEVEQSHALMQGEVKPLLAYPVIYLLFSLPMLIYRIDDIVDPNEPPRYVLLILSVITSPMLGVTNALAFALYGETLKLLTLTRIKSAFLSYCHASPSNIIREYSVIDENPNHTDEENSLLLRADAQVKV